MLMGKHKKVFKSLLIIFSLVIFAACGKNEAGKNTEVKEETKAREPISISVDDITYQSKLTPKFEEDISKYTVDVPSDCYGIKINLKADEKYQISVKDDSGSAIDPSPSDRKDEIKDGKENENEVKEYLLELSQEIEDYDSVYSKTVFVEIKNKDVTKKYEIKVNRESLAEIYNKFEKYSYVDEETGYEMDYLLHLPEIYDESATYPLIVALHGSGQIEQPINMTLKRYQMATTWIKNGYEDSIILVPHAKNKNEEKGDFETTWSIQDPDIEYGLGQAGKIAYKIIEKIRTDYAVDLNRQYLTGVSLGGQGTYAMIYEHPDDWAAALISCATTWDHNDEVAKTIKEYDIPIWIYHAPDDPVRPYTEFTKIVDALNRQGAAYRLTTFSNGEIFFPSAHFTWAPMYANIDALNWMMNQKKE